MKELKQIILLVLMAVTMAWSLNTSASGPTTAWETHIPSPTLIVAGMKQVWTYSHREKALYQMDAQTGAYVQKFFIQEWGMVAIASMASYQENILFFAARKNKKSKEYEYGLWRWGGTGVPEQVVTNLPTAERSHGMTCSQQSCVLILDQVYTTLNLRQWKKHLIPEAKKIENPRLRPDINPFASWQDKLLIGEGQYVAVAVGKKFIHLLDGLRGNIVNSRLNFEESEKLDVFRKWGKWGTWEGQFMFPKDMVYLKKYDLLAFVDSGLKHVFFFHPNGDYVGKFAPVAGLKYPIHLGLDNNRIFVSDFSANRVVAIDFQPLVEVEKEKKIEDFLHTNLYLNPKIHEDISTVRCLNCHDGTLRDSLHGFYGDKFQHPIGKEVTKKIDLPLENGKFVTCNSCHDQHHEKKMGDVFTRDGILQNNTLIPANLRASPNTLCQTCHQEKTQVASNHFNLHAGKNHRLTRKNVHVLACLQCHTPHAGEKQLLRHKAPELCLNCHQDHLRPQSHPLGNVVSLHGNKHVDCLSCHAMHEAAKVSSFGKMGKKQSCLECHTDLKENLGKNKHLAHGLNPKLKSPTNWPQQETLCLQCHDPHKKRLPVEQMCKKCHAKQIQIHEKLNPVAQTFRAEGIHLAGESVTCSTCHQHHGLSSEKKFFNTQDKLMVFCSSCHGPETTKLFNQYHTLLKDKHGRRK